MAPIPLHFDRYFYDFEQGEITQTTRDRKMTLLHLQYRLLALVLFGFIGVCIHLAMRGRARKFESIKPPSQRPVRNEIIEKSKMGQPLCNNEEGARLRRNSFSSVDGSDDDK